MLHVSRQKLLKQSVEHVSSAKFLGVYIDLTFNQECHKESTGTCKTNSSIFVPIKGIYLVVIFPWLPSAPTRCRGGGGSATSALRFYPIFSRERFVSRVAMVTRYVFHPFSVEKIQNAIKKKEIAFILFSCFQGKVFIRE